MASLLKFLPAKAKKFVKANPVAVRYIVDGLLVTSATAIATSNNNLFAMRLGANDFQLSLVQSLPQFFTLLVLIPGGLFMDSLHNKRRIVIVLMAMTMVGYLLCSLSPFAAAYSVQFFLVSLSLVGGAFALYNIAWQSFFPRVVDSGTRNHVLTLRTRMVLIIGMLVPPLVGAILTRIDTIPGKIIAHQGFFVSAILLFLLAALNFSRFRKTRGSTPNRISLAEILRAGKSLLHNKPFLLLTGTALFFHATWHFDWTLYFIGQVKYLHMNEFQLGLVPLGAAAAQLATLRFWSRINERYGVVLPFTFGIIGLSLCPVFMIISTSLPSSVGPHLFVIFHTFAHLPHCAITLNLFQCLLQVVDDEYRSFYMSVFASLLCLSHAIMPIAGVALYHALGGSLDGFRYAFGIIFSLRIVAAGLWLLRWRLQRRQETNQSLPD